MDAEWNEAANDKSMSNACVTNSALPTHFHFVVGRAEVHHYFLEREELRAGQIDVLLVDFISQDKQLVLVS